MAGLNDISLANYTFVQVSTNANFTGAKTFLIENIQSIGDLGDEATIVDVPGYGCKYLRKLVGSASAGPIDVVCNLYAGDGSFKELEGMYKTSERAYFRILMTDGENTTDGSENADCDAITTISGGDFISFKGFVASKSVGNAFDSTRTVTWSLAVDGAVSDIQALESAATIRPATLS